MIGKALDKPMEVYSTDEQVVGTWIDGKPLYRKIITATLGETNNKIATYDSSWRVKNWYGSIEWSSHFMSMIPYYSSSTDKIVIYTWSDGYIHVEKGSALGNGTIDLVVEYTKTTD